MATTASAKLIAELEKTIRVCPPARSARILQRVTELLRGTAGRLSTTQLVVFDEILIRLVDCVETPALAEFSNAVAMLNNARLEIVRRLAYHEEAAVAAPILQMSESLPDDDLLDVAENRGTAHGIAIAKRRRVSEAVCEALLDRSDTAVSVQLAKNAGAQFSRESYRKLTAMAERNDEIADLLVARADIPKQILHQLLSSLPRPVRARLVKIATPELQNSIHAAVESVEAGICATAPRQVDYSEAQRRIVELNKAGRLNDSTVNRFATLREYRELIVALSQLAGVPVETIETLLHEHDCYGLIVACRASRLNWNTTLAVISNRPDQARPSEQECEQGRQAYESLNLSAAQRLIRFGAIREFALKSQPHENTPAIAGAA